MILILKPDYNKQEVEEFRKEMTQRNFVVQDIQGETTHMLGLAGETSGLNADSFSRYSFVERVMRVKEPYKLAGRAFHKNDTVIDVGGNKIGGGNFAVIAGPCSVESEEQILSIARDVKFAGAKFLRGGAFKPRSSPYTFQGLGLDGLNLLIMAKQKTNLPIVTEIISTEYLDEFAKSVDVIQIGARNMQNFILLKEVGKLGKPVLLKRGMSSTITETLMSAEYIMAGGAKDVIICERGIRTFETATRNTLDLSAIPVLKQKTHLPVIADPSHSTGSWDLVESMSLAAVAAGADGLIIEVHDKPEKALCDGQQSITPELFSGLMKKIQRVYDALK